MDNDEVLLQLKKANADAEDARLTELAKKAYPDDSTRPALTKEEQRYLQYFWGKKRKRKRLVVPRDIIVFLESDGVPDSPAVSLYKIIFPVFDEVVHDMQRVISKGYVKAKKSAHMNSPSTGLNISTESTHI